MSPGHIDSMRRVRQNETTRKHLGVREKGRCFGVREEFLVPLDKSIGAEVDVYSGSGEVKSERELALIGGTA